MIPLFDEFPRLEEALPHVSLGELPTPVVTAARLGEELGIEKLYVKRDDVSGAIYGGNKVRKLEMLLGEAHRLQAEQVLTFGGAGSNHALATAIYGRQLGMDSISMLVPQPNARAVRQNLLMSYRIGAELNYVPHRKGLARATCYTLARHRLHRGSGPYIIPSGGTSPLGTVGFVNAAFELREQIRQGVLPEPERIYVPAGTLGTAAGLILGLRACGLRSRVVCVRVVDDRVANEPACLTLLRKTYALLRQADPSFSPCAFSPDDFDLRGEFRGECYGLYTEEGMEAVALMREHENIPIEGTYTGKTLAALVSDARCGRLDGRVVLFWNTYNSRDLAASVAGLDYRRLPPPLHPYFEESLQPLDRRTSA